MGTAPFDLMSPDRGDDAMRSFSEKVAAQLTRVRMFGPDLWIDTAVMFPSGRGVGVKLVGGPSHFTITDDGQATAEADLLGAEEICKREARKVTDDLGLKFDGRQIFETDVPADRAAAFCRIVVHASALSMARTTDRFAERMATRARTDLAMRLVDIFGASRVTKDVERSGASTKTWHFDAEVVGERTALYALVHPAPVSISTAYTKLDDVSRLDDAPTLAAVLDGTFTAEDKALLHRAASRIMRTGDADEVFRAGM